MKTLIASLLIAVSSNPAIAQSNIEYQAYRLGENVGKYYCHAVSKGVSTTAQMVSQIESDEAYSVFTASRMHREWIENGQKSLSDAYILGISDYTESNCDRQFQRYLDNH